MDNKISVVDIALPARRVELLSLLKASLKLMRLSQWVKNGFIFIPLVFSGRLFVVEDVSRTISVALAFCLAASGMYIVNDYMDIDRDRVHPVKKDRPLASGAMPVSAAFLLLSGILLAIIVLAVVEQVPQAGMLALGAYIGLQILYNLKLKELMIIDVLTIAVGFLIRVIAGAVVISVPVSSWLVLCTFSIAIFLALGKRRNEVLVLCGDAPSHRPCLETYNLALLDNYLQIVTTCTLIFYCLYSVSEHSSSGIGSQKMMLTIPLVVYGIFRYMYLIYFKGEGGSPTALLLKDYPMLICVGIWLATCIYVIYF